MNLSFMDTKKVLELLFLIHCATYDTTVATTTSTAGLDLSTTTTTDPDPTATTTTSQDPTTTTTTSPDPTATTTTGPDPTATTTTGPDPTTTTTTSPDPKTTTTTSPDPTATTTTSPDPKTTTTTSPDPTATTTTSPDPKTTTTTSPDPTATTTTSPDPKTTTTTSPDPTATTTTSQDPTATTTTSPDPTATTTTGPDPTATTTTSPDPKTTTTTGPDPTATTTTSQDPTATTTTGQDPTATTTTSPDPKTTTTTSPDPTATTTTGPDPTATTTTSPDPKTTTTTSPDPTSKTTTGPDPTSTTTTGPDPTSTTTTGPDPTATTTAAADPTTTTTTSPDPTSKTTTGPDPTSKTTTDPDPTSTTTTGPDPTSTTTTGPDPTSTTTTGPDPTSTTTTGPDPTATTTAAADPTTTTKTSPDPTTTTTTSPDPTSTTTTGPDPTTTPTTAADPTISTTAGPNSTVSQDILSINLTYPLANETIKLSIPEDQATGYVNKSVAVIIVSTTGELDLSIHPMYETTTDQKVNTTNDVQVFSFTENDAPYYYLYLGKSLDYEVINKFSLLVTLKDSNVSSVTYNVTFNITITDVNDVAPVILNLPNNVSLSRDEKSGYHIFTLNASDGDGTVENQVISYRIVSGNQDGIFSVDNTSGEVSLIRDSDQVPANVEEYNLTISAYSGDTAVENSGILTISIPNKPPSCTHKIVWAYSLDLTTASTGHTVIFLDSWSCSDVGDTLTYNITSVSPNLTAAFAIDSSTGTVSLSRTISSTEVPNRQIVLEITVKDQKNQMVTFSLFMNVTAMSCLPNSRNLYVRMDQELGGVILDNFNCTVNTGLTFSMKQYPIGTFEINGNSQLILRAAVVKIKFYSLVITITHSSDVVVLNFKVIIQSKRCGVSRGLSQYLQYNKFGSAFFVFCWISFSRFFFL